MWETSARLLKLLSLLQARRDWPGADLAARLDVTERTVRRDIGRLRDLGYPVHATRGTDGGYRLGAGAAMPPLLLDDDEAVAVAVGLRTAARSPVTGIEETSVRALAKLENVLPSRLRRRVSAVADYTVPVPPDTPPPAVDPAVLTTLASACRDHEQLRLDYRTHDGTSAVRSVEPHRLVSWGQKWYLLGWDTDRGDWRTFRVDRIQPRTPPGPRFTPRELPEGGDVAAYVARGVSRAASGSRPGSPCDCRRPCWPTVSHRRWAAPSKRSMTSPACWPAGRTACTISRSTWACWTRTSP